MNLLLALVEHFPAAVEEERTSCWMYLQVLPVEALVEKDEQVYVLDEQACDDPDGHFLGFVLIPLSPMAFLLLRRLLLLLLSSLS